MARGGESVHDGVSEGPEHEGDALLQWQRPYKCVAMALNLAGPLLSVESFMSSC